MEGVEGERYRIGIATVWINEGEWGSLGNRKGLAKESWVKNPQKQEKGSDLGSQEGGRAPWNLVTESCNGGRGGSNLEWFLGHALSTWAGGTIISTIGNRVLGGIR